MAIGAGKIGAYRPAGWIRLIDVLKGIAPEQVAREIGFPRAEICSPNDREEKQGEAEVSFGFHGCSEEVANHTGTGFMKHSSSDTPLKPF